MRQPAAAHQHLSVFGAAVQRRDHLARIEQARAVERTLDATHLLQLGGAELHAHRIELLDADTVLAALDDLLERADADGTGQLRLDADRAFAALSASADTARAFARAPWSRAAV